MHPETLPAKFINELQCPKQRLLSDLFEGSVNRPEVIIKRPAEDAEVYAYRLRSFVSSFPLKTAVHQLAASVTNQRPTISTEASATSAQIQLDSIRESWDEKQAINKLVTKLAIFGQIWLVPLMHPDGTPDLTVLSPADVLVDGESTLIWREYLCDVLNPETYDLEDFCRIHMVTRATEQTGLGLYSTYLAEVRKATTPQAAFSFSSTTYKGEYSYVLKNQRKDSLKLETSQPFDFGSIITLQTDSAATTDSLDLIVSFIRVKSALLDTINSNGYIQRVITPETSGNLDMPMDLESVDTSNQYILKAANFQFAEMSGSSIGAMLSTLESLRAEQLQELGLDLSASVSASGTSREIDSNRFKQLADGVGDLVSVALKSIYETLLTYRGFASVLQVSGLSDFSLTSSAGLVEEVIKLFQALALMPYQMPFELYRPVLMKLMAALLSGSPPHVIAELADLLPVAKPETEASPQPQTNEDLPTVITPQPSQLPGG